jgi:hypothetical protein
MSTAAMPTNDPLFVVRYLDVVVVVLAAPFVVLMGAPVLGYVAAAVAWILSRALGVYVESRAKRLDNPRAIVGLNFSVLMGRAWLLGLTILLVGLEGTREDGLMAALLALVAFTIYFATSLLIRPFERNTPRS